MNIPIIYCILFGLVGKSGKVSTQNLSQSLQTHHFKSLKDLDSKPKCVYDERMFKEDVKDSADDQGDPEQDYYEVMRNMNEAPKKKDSFKDFLSNSFQKTTTRKTSKVTTVSMSAIVGKDEEQSRVTYETEDNTLIKATNHGRRSNDSNELMKACDDPSDIPTLDCIDLGTEDDSSVYSRRSWSPTCSMRTTNTEFGEPNAKGRAAKVPKKSRRRTPRDILSSSIGGLMLWIPGFGSGRSNRDAPPSVEVERWSSNRDRKEVDERSVVSCESCNDEAHRSRRKPTCAALLFLLAIDIFTIALIAILFSRCSGPDHDKRGPGQYGCS